MTRAADRGAPSGPLAAYRAELLRWNRQINLLSRRDAPAAADQLIAQCADAFDLWWGSAGAELAAGGRVRWFDLGSGGGLPAFVWLVLLAGRGVEVEATLVEPRTKRAWFLERLARLPGAPGFRVVAARWGEGAYPEAGADNSPILFTLKALRLSEAAILGGLEVAVPAMARAPGADIGIVRFQPAEGVTMAGLSAELEVPAAGEAFSCGGLGFRSFGGRYLAPAGKAGAGAGAGAGAAGLFVTRHQILGADAQG
jgi:hypothetical protein